MLQNDDNQSLDFSSFSWYSSSFSGQMVLRSSLFMLTFLPSLSSTQHIFLPCQSKHQITDLTASLVILPITLNPFTSVCFSDGFFLRLGLLSGVLVEVDFLQGLCFSRDLVCMASQQLSSASSWSISTTLSCASRGEAELKSSSSSSTSLFLLFLSRPCSISPLPVSTQSIRLSLALFFPSASVTRSLRAAFRFCPTFQACTIFNDYIRFQMGSQVDSTDEYPFHLIRQWGLLSIVASSRILSISQALPAVVIGLGQIVL